jgi:GNAT superfamily N-acetyltransferase
VKKSAPPSKAVSWPVTDYRSATRPPRRPGAQKPLIAATPEPAEAIVTHDGRHLLLRPIQPSDAAALRRAFHRLTPEQIRARFFFRMNELSEALAARLSNVDPETSAAFVVTDTDDVAPAEIEIRGEARMYVDPVTQSAEFALAVDPAFIGQGVGSALLRRLLAECRKRGLLELWGDVLADNHAMLELVRHLDGEHAIEQGSEPGLIRVRLAVPQGVD